MKEDVVSKVYYSALPASTRAEHAGSDKKSGIDDQDNRISFADGIEQLYNGTCLR